MSPHVVLNATAYDGLPSGARARATGLAAALLEAGARVTVLSPRGVPMADLIRAELDDPAAAAGLHEIPTPFASAAPLRRALFSRRWIAARIPADADLFVTDFYPVLDDVPTALTIHDLRYLVAPQFESASRAAWFRRFYPRLARRAPLVLVPTETVAGETTRVLGVEPDRVRVVRNALGRTWRDARIAHRSAEWVLAVGVGDARKDLRTLVAAVRRLADAGEPVLPLLIVGRRDRRIERLMHGAQDLEARGLVRHAGVVTDERLCELYERAAALVHPSRYEGFGLTVIEAMALGVPVVAGRCPAVEEVADGLARWIAPGDVAGWADALGSLARATPPTDDVRCAAQDYARRFSWREGARTILAAIA